MATTTELEFGTAVKTTKVTYNGRWNENDNAARSREVEGTIVGSGVDKEGFYYQVMHGVSVAPYDPTELEVVE